MQRINRELLSNSRIFLVRKLILYVHMYLVATASQNATKKPFRSRLEKFMIIICHSSVWHTGKTFCMLLINIYFYILCFKFFTVTSISLYPYFICRMELLEYYENKFGKLSKLPESSYQTISAAYVKPRL